MSKTKTGILSGVLLCTPLVAGIQTATAQPVPGGTLDPLTIPKYVTPLVIPPVLYDDSDDWDDDDDDRKRGKMDDDEVELVVAQRQFRQQVLPTEGCSAVQAVNPDQVCVGDAFPRTTLWGYGDPERPNTFNNPAFTIEVTKDNTTTVAWVNELVKNPNRCFDDYEFEDGSFQIGREDDDDPKNTRACKFLPHIIQDQNGLPIIDQTLHWAAPNMDCLDGMPRTDCRGASADPYTGPIPMVVHVHGAHVGPGSDGYPEAWWLPDASNIDCTNVPGHSKTKTTKDDFACNGTFFESAEGADTRNALGEGYAIDIYSNDQPTTTLWYHDHTLGMTRLNVYAASAGFWLIRDQLDGETGLLEGVLPGPAPQIDKNPNCSRLEVTGRKGRRCMRERIREIPLAIQPKSFNADGSQYYPADRAFFEGLGDGGTFALNNDLNIPFLPQATSDIAPVWNPEAFFNTMVVNGNTWPQLDVAAERYRFRVLNAADSRFLNMALNVVNADGTLGDEIPFYQIGAEQGLLPNVVRIMTGEAVVLPGDGTEPARAPDMDDPTALLVGPAERADVIVDFSGLRNGTVVRMINTAPDAPFGGFPDVPADPSTTGQVMQFVVSSALNTPGGDPSSPPADLVLDPNPGGVPKLGPSSVTQDLALLEEESGLICVEIDAVTGVINQVPGTPPCAVGEAFAPKAAVLGVNGSGGGTVQLWDDPIAQNPAVNSIETWELWNWSADAHPIHLHLVKFEVLDRAPVGDSLNRRPAEPWEAGWKDTVIAYPDEVTRVKALFDIPGLYVWHCHILSHEDNEMMVPFCVGKKGADCPAELF